jgi:CheY-like chemotaxis protein
MFRRRLRGTSNASDSSPCGDCPVADSCSNGAEVKYELWYLNSAGSEIHGTGHELLVCEGPGPVRRCPIERLEAFESVPGPHPPQLRILVVDDEPLVCDSVRRMLARDGHLVSMAFDGEEALEFFKTGKFGLVITDYAMPGMKGDQLAIAVKAHDPETWVALITAYLEAMTPPPVAVDFLLGKPVHSEELRETITRCHYPKNSQRKLPPARRRADSLTPRRPPE